MGSGKQKYTSVLPLHVIIYKYVILLRSLHCLHLWGVLTYAPDQNKIFLFLAFGKLKLFVKLTPSTSTTLMMTSLTDIPREVVRHSNIIILEVVHSCYFKKGLQFKKVFNH